MTSIDRSRRDFLAASGALLGSGYLFLHLPVIISLAACARDAARTAESFHVLTPTEAEAMRAFAARIFPADELPGAEEAGAVYFVDRALEGPFAPLTELIRAGLEDLDERARTRVYASFGALPESRQDEVIREIEAGPFFAPARMLVLMGVLADPEHGGNRNGAAPELVGMTHAAAWAPPFGYYDAEVGRDLLARDER